MESNLQTGRVILITMFGLILLSDFIVISVLAFKAGPDGLKPGLIRLGLTFGLFYAVYSGHTWARWLTILLFGGTSAYIAAQLSSGANAVMITLLVLFVATLLALTCIPPCVQFLNYQRQQRNT